MLWGTMQGIELVVIIAMIPDLGCIVDVVVRRGDFCRLPALQALTTLFRSDLLGSDVLTSAFRLVLCRRSLAAGIVGYFVLRILFSVSLHHNMRFVDGLFDSLSMGPRSMDKLLFSPFLSFGVSSFQFSVLVSGPEG